MEERQREQERRLQKLQEREQRLRAEENGYDASDLVKTLSAFLNIS